MGPLHEVSFPICVIRGKNSLGVNFQAAHDGIESHGLPGVLLSVAMEPSRAPKGELVIRTIAMPADTNPSGDIFGGWIMSQMDLGSGIIAAKTAKTRVVTVAMEGMSFLQPVRVGDTVACYAWVEKIGRTSMTIPVEVWVQRYRSGEEVRVTHGVFTYVAVDNEGKPIPVRRSA
jgi:acyl-CoA thioesterase YciA